MAPRSYRLPLRYLISYPDPPLVETRPARRPSNYQADMTPPAWATLFEGLSSYAAIGSAYFFARPALRFQPLRTTLEFLEEGDEHPDPEVKILVQKLRDDTRKKLATSPIFERRSNIYGLTLLVVSALLLATAVLIHVYGESSAGSEPNPASSSRQSKWEVRRVIGRPMVSNAAACARLRGASVPINSSSQPKHFHDAMLTVADDQGRAGIALAPHSGREWLAPPSERWRRK